MANVVGFPVVPLSLAQLPPLSPRLVGALRDASPARFSGGDGDDPGIVIRPPGVSADAKREAAERLARLEALPKIDNAAMAAWLDPIIAAKLPNGPPADAMRGVIYANTLVCRDLPAAALTDGALAAGFAKWRFYPAPPEIRAALEAEAAPWLRQVAACRAILAAPDAEGTQTPSEDYLPPVRTPEQIAHNASVDAMKTAARRGEPPPPRPLSPEALKELRDASRAVLAARKEGGNDV